MILCPPVKRVIIQGQVKGAIHCVGSHSIMNLKKNQVCYDHFLWGTFTIFNEFRKVVEQTLLKMVGKTQGYKDLSVHRYTLSQQQH